MNGFFLGRLGGERRLIPAHCATGDESTSARDRDRQKSATLEVCLTTASRPPHERSALV